jgi:antitoxin (DNA-binding transcriptional repressor) of toxin-antitoxin stability system
MKRIGIRELKDRLSEYLRQVRDGEVVEVTDRGTVVAELRAPTVGGELERRYPGLVEMARKGSLRLPLEPNSPGAYPLLAPVAPPGTAARLLAEERGER